MSLFIPHTSVALLIPHASVALLIPQTSVSLMLGYTLILPTAYHFLIPYNYTFLFQIIAQIKPPGHPLLIIQPIFPHQPIILRTSIPRLFLLTLILFIIFLPIPPLTLYLILNNIIIRCKTLFLTFLFIIRIIFI